MHTRLLSSEDLVKKSRKSCEDIQKICRSEVTITQSGYHNDPVQTLLMRRGFNNDPLITPIIEASAIQAEKNAAGSGELFLRIFSNEMLEDISRRSIGIESDSEWDRILDAVEKNSIPARRRDIKNLFLSSSDCYQKIMNRTFDLLCADDKVYVRKTASSSSSISRDPGYSFENLGIDPRFLSKGPWSKNQVRVILIDGIIERVSEIHSLLEEMSQTRTPCVIFCLDALPEVYETLVKNFSMGNLDVVMIKVPVDEMSVNTLVDLGTIFGIEPIRASSGETITLGIKNQVSKADVITISKGKISIEKRDSKNQVRDHIKRLRKKIDENINLAQIIEPRIRSLSSSTVRINVGLDDQKRDPNIVEKLDRTFRSLPKIIRLGFIEKNDLKGFSSSKIDLLFNRNNAVPAEMAIQSIKIFLSTRKAIGTAGAGIETIQY